MNLWEVDRLVLFLVFFIPGFVSIKIYDLIIPGESRDFSKSLAEAVGYSALNYAFFSWLIVWLYSSNLFEKSKAWFFVTVFVIMLVAPAIWPVLFTRLWKWGKIAKHFIHPIKKPWDYVFSQGQDYWIIIHLKDGRKIGGRFQGESFASSFPAEEQIYLEEVWKLDAGGRFQEPVERSAGIIVQPDEILAVELFI